MRNLIKSTLLLLALLLPATAIAHDFCVDGIYYNIRNNNEATVTYRGTSYWNHNTYSGAVTIPVTVAYNGTTYSVASIGYRAFYGCSGLTSVIIGNSVSSISNDAFINCSGLTSVTIPNSVTSIGIAAFFGCSGLTSITIPNSVTSIGNQAFEGTAWYNNQPDGVVYAGLVAYIYKGIMSSGTSITLKDGTLGIASGAFSDCTGLTSMTIPNSVISISDGAFSGCSGLTSLSIPNSVTSIGDGAFQGCIGLTSMTIPNSVTSIGVWAFAYCSGLTSLSIPNSVTSIGYEAFVYCGRLTDVYCYITDLSQVLIGGSPFYDESYDNSHRTLHVPVGSLAAYQADVNWYPCFGQIVEMDLMGDANIDGHFNIGDVCDTIDYLLGNEITPFNPAGADLNDNGRVDMGDLTDLIDLLLTNNQ